MYSINIEPNGGQGPNIKRDMSANAPLELFPVVVQILKDQYNWTNPVIIYMDSGRYIGFDLLEFGTYAEITIEGMGG